MIWEANESPYNWSSAPFPAILLQTPQPTDTRLREHRPDTGETLQETLLDLFHLAVDQGDGMGGGVGRWGGSGRWGREVHLETPLQNAGQASPRARDLVSKIVVFVSKCTIDWQTLQKSLCFAWCAG